MTFISDATFHKTEHNRSSTLAAPCPDMNCPQRSYRQAICSHCILDAISNHTSPCRKSFFLISEYQSVCPEEWFLILPCLYSIGTLDNNKESTALYQSISIANFLGFSVAYTSLAMPREYTKWNVFHIFVLFLSAHRDSKSCTSGNILNGTELLLSLTRNQIAGWPNPVSFCHWSTWHRGCPTVCCAR